MIRVCISFCTRSEQCCLVLYAKAVLRLIWLCNHILKESTVFTMILGCKSNSQLSEQVKNAKTKEGQDFWNSVSIFSSGWTRCTSYNVMTSVIPFFKLIIFPRYHRGTWIFNSYFWSEFSHIGNWVAIMWSKNRAEEKAEFPWGRSSLTTNVTSLSFSYHISHGGNLEWDLS